MRHFFSIFFSALAFALVINAAGVVPTAHAVGIGESCTTSSEGIGSNCSAGSYCDPTTNKCVANPPSSSAKSSDIGKNVPTGPTLDDNEGFGKVMTWIMKLFAWLVGVAAITLDNVVYYTVVTMGDYIHRLAAVGVAWRILRDIANIALIFGFLAIGITTILDVNWYGGSTKLLPILLIAAVLLNFSLFISEAVIDTGNLFATQVYTQINGGKAAGAKNFDLDSLLNNNDGISNKIMAQLGLQSIYGDALKNKDIFKAGNSWIVGFMGIILFMITAFVMFSLALILVARFVILLFLIIAAPIGFAGYAIPQLGGIAKKWRDALIAQTITAPVLLLMLYIALAIITDESFLKGFCGAGTCTKNWYGFVEGNDLTGFASMLLSFLVAMGLLSAVTMYAKKMGAFGADFATKWGGRASFGLAAWGGRATLGLTGRGLNNRRMQAWASKGGFGGTIAKGFAATGRTLENRTYDIRNIKPVGKVLSGGALGYSTGVGQGSSVTAKQAFKKAGEMAKTYKPLSGEWWRNQQREYEKTANERQRKADLASPGTPAFKSAIRKMSTDDLAMQRGIREGKPDFVKALSPAQYAELQKTDKLLSQEKKKLKDEWVNQFTAGNAAATIGRLSTEEIASLGGDILTGVTPSTMAPVIDSLSSSDLDAIRRKGALKTTERHDMHAYMMAAPAGSALKAKIDDYFLAANDPGGNRKKYWDV